MPNPDLIYLITDQTERFCVIDCLRTVMKIRINYFVYIIDIR